MHYTLEIVMPQVDDVIEATEQIMRPFDENLSIAVLSDKKMPHSYKIKSTGYINTRTSRTSYGTYL